MAHPAVFSEQHYMSDGTDDEVTIEVGASRKSEPGYISPPDWSSDSARGDRETSDDEPQTHLTSTSKPNDTPDQGNGQSDPNQTQPQSSIPIRSQDQQREASPNTKTMDRNLYWYCIYCIRGHQSCDMGSPACNKCRGRRDCVYYPKSRYLTQKKALEAYKVHQAERLDRQPQKVVTLKTSTSSQGFAAVNKPQQSATPMARAQTDPATPGSQPLRVATPITHTPTNGYATASQFRKTTTPKVQPPSDETAAIDQPSRRGEPLQDITPKGLDSVIPTAKPASIANSEESPKKQTSINPANGLPLIQTVDSNDSDFIVPCPDSILRLLSQYQQEFESEVLKAKWSNTISITVNEHKQHILYVDLETQEELPITRYEYGLKKQFCVGWPRGKDPAIFTYFETKSNKITVHKASHYRSVVWRSWSPKGAMLPRSHILEDRSHDSNLSKVTVADLSRSMGYTSSPEITNDNKRRRSAPVANDEPVVKKIRQHYKTSEEDTSRLDLKSNGIKNIGRASLPARIESTKDDSHTQDLTSMNDPDISNVQVVFKDKEGKVQGICPFDECDTAEKLFQQACFYLIDLDPFKVRLFKLDLNDRVVGLRPDNKNDFEQSFLKAVTKASESEVVQEVVIRHAL